MTPLALMLWPGDAGTLTKVGLVALSLLATFIVLRLVPPSWRPSGVVVPLAAAAVAFIAIRVAAETTFSEWLDHEVFERIGGETDDFPTWLIAGSAAAAVFRLDTLRRRRR